MEVLVRYGTKEHQERWLKPLLAGEIRSCFAMTEPEVASSDATNIQAEIRRDGDEYVINGRKWWTSGAMDPRCKIAIVMGKTDPSAPKHQQQSMILVPMDTPGSPSCAPSPSSATTTRPTGTPRWCSRTCACRPPTSCSARAAASRSRKGRLGPGRIHHCMRQIGVAERALETLCRRALSRTAFGKPIADHGVNRHWIAESRMDIDQARLLTLQAAHMMDEVGNKQARAEIAMIKVVAPNVALRVIDRAIQVCGGAGVSQDFHLAMAYAHARTLRLADGPDEVHRETIAKIELSKYMNPGPGRRSAA
jgi:acyl-CoA dehydrogenase